MLDVSGAAFAPHASCIRMQTGKLYNGVTMLLEGFGGFQVTDREGCLRTVQPALGAGYRRIDTASSYQNEQAVGAAIRGRSCSSPPRRTFTR